MQPRQAILIRRTSALDTFRARSAGCALDYTKDADQADEQAAQSVAERLVEKLGWEGYGVWSLGELPDGSWAYVCGSEHVLTYKVRYWVGFRRKEARCALYLNGERIGGATVVDDEGGPCVNNAKMKAFRGALGENLLPKGFDGLGEIVEETTEVPLQRDLNKAWRTITR